MRLSSHSFLLVTSLAAVVYLANFGAGAPTTRPFPPIPLKEIQDRGIEGSLGAKLGTIVEVTGEVVPNRSGRKADIEVPFFLRIETVDGKALAEPVLFRFSKRSPTINTAPKIGDRFRFIGFETGRYEGSPDGEFTNVLVPPTIGYGFTTSFEVLSPK